MHHRQFLRHADTDLSTHQKAIGAVAHIQLNETIFGITLPFHLCKGISPFFRKIVAVVAICHIHIEDQFLARIRQRICRKINAVACFRMLSEHKSRHAQLLVAQKGVIEIFFATFSVHSGHLSGNDHHCPVCLKAQLPDPKLLVRRQIDRIFDILR